MEKSIDFQLQNRHRKISIHLGKGDGECYRDNNDCRYPMRYDYNRGGCDFDRDRCAEQDNPYPDYNRERCDDGCYGNQGSNRFGRILKNIVGRLLTNRLVGSLGGGFSSPFGGFGNGGGFGSPFGSFGNDGGFGSPFGGFGNDGGFGSPFGSFGNSGGGFGSPFGGFGNSGGGFGNGIGSGILNLLQGLISGLLGGRSNCGNGGFGGFGNNFGNSFGGFGNNCGNQANAYVYAFMGFFAGRFA